MWRHIYAMRLLEAQDQGRLTTHERHVLIELAYIQYSRNGRRQRGVSGDLR
jgi:hypothetical protein